MVHRRVWLASRLYARLRAVVPFCLATGILLAVTTAPAKDGQLQVTVVDGETGKTIPCRMHLQGPNGRPRKINRVPYWHDHFVFPGDILLRLPTGNYAFELERGPEYVIRAGRFTINQSAEDSKQVDLKRFVDMSAEGWWSGDLDVRRSLDDIELLMLAEDLHVVPLVTWWNDQNSWTDKKMPENPLVEFDGNRYYHLLAGSQARGGAGLLVFQLPTPLAQEGNDPEYPSTAHYLEQVRQHEGVWIDVSRPYWWDMPMLVAGGLIDSIQVLHGQICRDQVLDDEPQAKPRETSSDSDPWGNALWSQEIYFRLLNCGLHIPPSAGSGSGVSPNPVGCNRVYVHVDGPFSYEKWWEGLRNGQVLITNGPLLQPSVQGQPPGYIFHGDEGKPMELEIDLDLWNRHPVDAKESIHYLEIIKDGRVEHSVRLQDYATSGKLPKVCFEQSGWFLVRAVTDVQKTYRFAMTGPYYVEIGCQPRISKRAAQFFLDWVFERARQLKIDDPEHRREVLGYHRKARDFWQDLVTRANAE